MRPFRIVGTSNFRAYSTFLILCISFGFIIWEMVVSLQMGQPFADLIEDYALMTCHVGREPFSETLIDGLRSLFLHTTFIGFVTNMLFLWVFAPRIEQYMGHRLFLVFYLIAGIGGHVLSVLFDGGQCVPVYDPSASITGMLGAFLLLYPTTRIEAFVPLLGRAFNLPVIVFVVVYVGAQVFTEAGGPLSGDLAPYWDEVGGFVTGILFLFIATMLKPPPKVDPFEYLDD